VVGRSSSWVAIAITRHASELRAARANVKLSADRALSVSQALAAQGIPLRILDVIAVGDAEPLRAGSSEWDRIAYRSVSFRTELGPTR